MMKYVSERQFWDNLKENASDALYLIRAGEVYRLYMRMRQRELIYWGLR